MKLKCFVLPTLVISLLGHRTNAGPSKPNRVHDPRGSCSGLGCSGRLTGSYAGSNEPHVHTGSLTGDGAGNFGVTASTASGGKYGGNVGGGYGGSSRGSSGPSEALDGSLGGTTPGRELGSMAENGIGPNLGGGEGSPDVGGGGGNGGRGDRSSSRGYSYSTGFVGQSLRAGLDGDPSRLGAEDSGYDVAGGARDRSGYDTLSGCFSGSPNIVAVPFGGPQPAVRPDSADSLSTSTSSVGGEDHGPTGEPHFREGSLSSVGGGGAYGIMAGNRSPEREHGGNGAPRDGVPLDLLAGSPPQNSPGSHIPGFTVGVDVPTSSGGRGVSVGPGLGGLGGEPGIRTGGLGTGRSTLGRGHSLGLRGGGEGGLLSRLGARIRARARALAAAHARAQARAKARSRARALTRARFRARLRAAFHSSLNIGGGIDGGLEKAAELNGAGELGGRAGLGGEGGVGLAGNGELGASPGAGGAFYGGTLGYGGSYGAGYDGAYEFYDK